MAEINDYLNADRRDFTNEALEISDLLLDPQEQFNHWLQEAKQAAVREPYACCLSTTGLDGCPSSRMVFLRDIIDTGLVWYTNYESQKAAELSAVPMAALNFHWAAQDRQVRVWGRVEKVSAEMSDTYFAKRPRASQIGAWASAQSTVLRERADLESRIKDLDIQYADQEVPRPSGWGGYVLSPIGWEFWQGRRSRLHDRFRYAAEEGGVWTISRLNP